MTNSNLVQYKKLKTNAFRLILGCISIAFTLVSCNSKLGSSMGKDQINQSAAKPDESETKSEEPKILITETDPYDSLPHEEKEKYEPPPKEIKVGEHSINLDKMNFFNLAYRGDKKGAVIKGELSLNEVEDYSIDERFKFELKGELNGEDREFKINFVDIDRRTGKGHRLRLGAKVTCRIERHENDTPIYNCDEARIDFFARVKQLKLSKTFVTKNLRPGDTKPNPQTPDPIQTPQQPDPTPTAPITTPDVVPSQPAPNGGEGEDTTTAPAAPPAEPEQPSVTEIPTTTESDSTANKGETEQAIEEGEVDKIIKPVQLHLKSEEDADDFFAEEDDSSDEKNPKPKKVDPPKKTQIKNGILTSSDGKLIRPVDQAYRYADGGELRNATNVLLQHRQMKHDELYVLTMSDNQKYYASWEMAQIILKLGEFKSKNLNSKLYVGSLSLIKGGFASPHSSHQNGMDADFGFPNDTNTQFPEVAIEEAIKENGKFVRDKKNKKIYRTIAFNPRAYSPEKTLALLEAAFTQSIAPISRIFMNQKIIDHLCQSAKQSGLIDMDSKDPKKVEKTNFWKKIFSTIQHVPGHGDHMHIRIGCTRMQRDCLDYDYTIVNNCQK